MKIIMKVFVSAVSLISKIEITWWDHQVKKIRSKKRFYYDVEAINEFRRKATD